MGRTHGRFGPMKLNFSPFSSVWTDRVYTALDLLCNAKHVTCRIFLTSPMEIFRLHSHLGVFTPVARRAQTPEGRKVMKGNGDGSHLNA